MFNKYIKQNLINQTLNSPLRTLFISLGLIVIMGLGLLWFDIDDDFVKLLPQDIPSKIIWDDIQEDFGASEIMLIAFGDKDTANHIYRKEIFDSIWDLTTALENEHKNGIITEFITKVFGGESKNGGFTINLSDTTSQIEGLDGIITSNEGVLLNLTANRELNALTNIEIFDAKYEVANLTDFDNNKNYFAFSGIGNHETFLDTLKLSKLNIVENKEFPDHFDYSFSDIKSLVEYASKKKLDLVTTKKDFLKIDKLFLNKIKYLDINLAIKDEIKLLQKII